MRAEVAVQLAGVGRAKGPLLCAGLTLYNALVSAAVPSAALRGLGRAAVIVAAAASGSSMSPLIPGLGARGQLVVVGTEPDPIEARTTDLIFEGRVVRGVVTGTPIENEDNVRFTIDHGIHSHNEVLTLGEAPKAYERTFSGRARFRMVFDVRG